MPRSLLLIPFVEIASLYVFIQMGQSDLFEPYRYAPFAIAMIMVIGLAYNGCVGTHKNMVIFAYIDSLIFLVLDILISTQYYGLRKEIDYFSMHWFSMLSTIFLIYFSCHLLLFFVVLWAKRITLIMFNSHIFRDVR